MLFCRCFWESNYVKDDEELKFYVRKHKLATKKEQTNNKRGWNTRVDFFNISDVIIIMSQLDVPLLYVFTPVISYLTPT